MKLRGVRYTCNVRPTVKISGDRMFLSFAAACLSAVHVSQSEPALLSYQSDALPNMTLYILSEPTRDPGVSQTRMMPMPADAPLIGPEVFEMAPLAADFLGMLRIMSGTGQNYRRRDLPQDALERVNALQIGETYSFTMRHDTRLNGQRRVFQQDHVVTLVGCSQVDYPGLSGATTRVYEVETASRVVDPARGDQIRPETYRVEVLAEQGWVVRRESVNEPPMQLVRFQRAR